MSENKNINDDKNFWLYLRLSTFLAFILELFNLESHLNMADFLAILYIIILAGLYNAKKPWCQFHHKGIQIMLVVMVFAVSIRIINLLFFKFWIW